MRRTAADGATEIILALRPAGGGWGLFSRDWDEPLTFLSDRAALAAAHEVAARLRGQGRSVRLDVYDRDDRPARVIRFTPGAGAAAHGLE